MINIVILIKDRPKLTLQCLNSLVKNTTTEYTVVVVDDGSQPETRDMLRLFGQRKNVDVLRTENSRHVTGGLRNLGVYWSEKRWGRGDWLYLSDNDAYFKQGWDVALTDALTAHKGFAVIGGQNHPYHLPLSSMSFEANCETGRYNYVLSEYGALAGTSWMMPWSAWDRFGPLNDNGQPGVCQSEDHAFCQRVREAGLLVGAMSLEVVIDCGITNSDGKPSIGADVKKRVEGVYYE